MRLPTSCFSFVHSANRFPSLPENPSLKYIFYCSYLIRQRCKNPAPLKNFLLLLSYPSKVSKTDTFEKIFLKKTAWTTEFLSHPRGYYYINLFSSIILCQSTLSSSLAALRIRCAVLLALILPSTTIFSASSSFTFITVRCSLPDSLCGMWGLLGSIHGGVTLNGGKLIPNTRNIRHG